MSVLAKKRSDRGRRSAFHMTCPGTEDVFVNPASCQFSLFTKGINHLLLLSPLTPDPPARPPLCRLEEAGKQFRLRLPSPPTGGCVRGPPLALPAWGAAVGDTPTTTTITPTSPPTPPPNPGRICAPAASLGSCCEGTGATTKGRGAGGGTTSLPSIPPSRGCQSSWPEPAGCGEGVLGAAPRGPPVETP